MVYACETRQTTGRNNVLTQAQLARVAPGGKKTKPRCSAGFGLREACFEGRWLLASQPVLLCALLAWCTTKR
jgi:hypothetical protein